MIFEQKPKDKIDNGNKIYIIPSLAISLERSIDFSLQVDIRKSAKCGPVELFETDKGIRAKTKKKEK